ncbi:hypothetical protein JW948_03370 [bacterium]|nr:hypothetical protein [bacterium]
MKTDTLLEILQQCLKMEGQAIRIYALLAENAAGEVQAFWKDMTGQEKEHAQYWQLLIHLAEEGKIRNIFDYPERILSELKGASLEVDKLVQQIDPGNLVNAFTIAYMLEFTLLHPAFPALFLSMRSVTGDRSPGDRYHEHLHNLIRAYRLYSPGGSPFELVADLSDKLLLRNEQIAEQLMEIRQLRGLLPICMHCKNIRTEKGLWIRVENYIEAHSEAEFSHGICPDCIKKYYGEYFSDEDFQDQA